MKHEAFEAARGCGRAIRIPAGRRWSAALLVGLLLTAPALLFAEPDPAPRAGEERPVAHRIGLGTSLLYAQRYDEAAREFEKVLESEPLHRDARLGLARAHYWSGRPRRAAEALAPLMADTPDAEVVALYNEVSAASGDTLLAMEAMQKSLAAQPDASGLLQSKADLLVSTGCFIPAIKLLNELFDKHPDSAAYGLALAHAYFTADRYPEAIELYERFLDEPGSAGVRANLGLARTHLKEHRVPESVRYGP